jgi:hypothetical protein
LNLNTQTVIHELEAKSILKRDEERSKAWRVLSERPYPVWMFIMNILLGALIVPQLMTDISISFWAKACIGVVAALAILGGIASIQLSRRLEAAITLLKVSGDKYTG